MRIFAPVAMTAFGLMLAAATCAWTGDAAAAQAGISQPTGLRSLNAHHPFPTRAVWPHEVMTYEERYDTWLKMREAQTPGERYAVWAKKRAELENRAAEHGMILRDQSPLPMAMAREDRYAPYGAHAPLAAAAPYGQPYAPAYQQRPMAPERPAQAPGWVGPHYFGVMPHLMPPVGR